MTCAHVPKNGKADDFGLIHVHCRVCGKLLGYSLPAFKRPERKKVKR